MKNRIIKILIISTLISSCNFKQKEKELKENKENIVEIENVVYKKDTIKINGEYYIQILEDEDFRCQTTMNGDTVIKSEIFYHDAIIYDINGDGYEDIEVRINTNVGGVSDTYFYDAENKQFRIVEGCEFDLRLIKGTTSYFYNYHRAGCADLAWESDLCKVQNFKLTRVARTYGNGCTFEKSYEIKIFKVKSNGNEEEEILIETLPYKKNISKNDKKWVFIEKYWNKNYQKFL